MFLSRVFRPLVPALGGLAVATAALLFPHSAVAQSATPQYPLGAKAYERFLIDQEFRRQQAAPRPAAPESRREYYIPPGAPVGRTYTWYAPPEGYQVIMEGTPSAPQYVTVVGPDGVTRTHRVEGPIVMRPHHYVVRNTSR